MQNKITLIQVKRQEEEITLDFSHALNLLRLQERTKRKEWQIKSNEWIFKDNEITRSKRSNKEPEEQSPG